MLTDGPSLRAEGQTVKGATMIDSGSLTLRELLAETDYPATRDDLLRLARFEGAGGQLISLLEGLPNRSFNGIWDVHSTMERELATAV
jgi:hypothetical protein